MGRLSEKFHKLGIGSRPPSKSPRRVSKTPDPEEPEPSSVPRPVGKTTASNDLWALAWERFALENQEEANNFRTFIARSSLQMQSQQDGQEIAKSITDAYEKHQAEHEVSQKVKDTFHKIISSVQKGGQFIGFAVSFNPIAASVWTGVSLVIPLLLMPGNQNEAASETLKECVELLQCYQSYEHLLRGDDNDSVKLAREKIVSLYVTVLDFEAKLASHRDQKGARRLMNSFKHDWSETSKRFKAIDIEFKSHMDVVRDIWTQRERRRREDVERMQQSNDTIAALYVDVSPPKARRVPGTCEWFLRRPEFLSWRTRSSGLLWVTADPGCGKSVLAKYLVENRNELLQEPDENLIVASFFFSGGQSFSNSTTAMCALMNQILAAATEYSEVVDHFCRSKGMPPGDIKTSKPDKVWLLFRKVMSAVTAKHKIICVLDALDECESASLEVLLDVLDELYTGQTGDIPFMRFLITSRPYEELLRGLRRTVKIKPDVRIDAAEEQDAIKDEISIVIVEKVKELSEDKALDESNQRKLLSALQSAEHKTYLWLYLVLERFKSEWIHAGQDISVFVNTMPNGVEEEYSSILSRMKDTHLADARKVFQIILVSLEPLTATAVYEALRMTETATSLEDLKPGIARPVAEILRDICGLFIIVDQKNRLYFLHQTARDYLLEERWGPSRNPLPRQPENMEPYLKWHHEFSMFECERVLAESCLRFICLLAERDLEPDLTYMKFRVDDGQAPIPIVEYYSKKKGRFARTPDDNEMWKNLPALLPYVGNFFHHLLGLGSWIPEELLHVMFRLELRGFNFDLTHFERYRVSARYHRKCSMVEMCAVFEMIPYLAYKRRMGADLYVITETPACCLLRGPQFIYNDRKVFSIPLNEAILRNRQGAVAFLLEPESLPTDHTIFNTLHTFGTEHPLRRAALNGPEMLKLVSSRSEFRESLVRANDRLGLVITDGSWGVESLKYLYHVELSYTTRNDTHDGYSLLLWGLMTSWEHGKSLEQEDFYKIAVSVAPSSVNEVMSSGLSPLCFALHEDSSLATRLLADGASWTARAETGANALHGSSHSGLTRLKPEALDSIPPEQLQSLLNSPDNKGVTPLLQAIEVGDKNLTEVLLDVSGIQVHLASHEGETPLQVARENGSEWEDVVDRLMEMGAT